MGFDARPTPTFGPDQWATTILLVILLSVGMMVFMPGTNPIELGKVLTIAITFGVSIGFAVLGAIVVAQRFIERHEGDRLAFPPVAELVLAALIVAGLSIAMRIGVPLVPALMQGQGFQDVLNQFVDRLPGVITPFICTVSLGLLCSYLGSLDWSWYRVWGVGAVGNGLSLMFAGWLVGSLLDPKVLAQFYVHGCARRRRQCRKFLSAAHSSSAGLWMVQRFFDHLTVGALESDRGQKHDTAFDTLANALKSSKTVFAS
jgi:hypothetical protein